MRLALLLMRATRVVLVQVLVQEFLEFLLFFLDARTETDQRRRGTHFVDSARIVLCNERPAALGQVGYQRVDHAPDCFMDQAAVSRRAGYCALTASRCRENIRTDESCSMVIRPERNPSSTSWLL